MEHPHHGKSVCSERKGQGVMGGALAVCCKYQHGFREKESQSFCKILERSSKRKNLESFKTNNTNKQTKNLRFYNHHNPKL